MEVPKEIQAIAWPKIFRGGQEAHEILRAEVCLSWLWSPPPPPSAHLSSAPAPRAGSHQSRDFFEGERFALAQNHTLCLIITETCYCSPCLVLFINLFSLAKTTVMAKPLSLAQLPDKSSVKTEACDILWTAEGLTDRKALLLLLCSGVTWKKQLPLSIDGQNVNFSSIRVRSSVTDDMSAI